MKVIIIDNLIYYECPDCKSEIELGLNFCPDCGEAIDWKEED